MTTEKVSQLKTGDQTQHRTIAGALASAQRQMGKALKESQNPHFRSKYADLGNVMDACMPALNANGIAVIQPVRENEFGRSVVTIFIHESGETLECAVPLILNKQDMQGLGSAMTYARRYGLMALAGIAPEDDDGNAAVAAQNAKTDYAVREKSWAETVIDHLPEGATEHEKAIALRDAIIGEFKRKKSETQLSNEWDRRAKIIDQLEAKKPGIKAEIVDAYEARVMALTGNDA